MVSKCCLRFVRSSIAVPQEARLGRALQCGGWFLSFVAAQQTAVCWKIPIRERATWWVFLAIAFTETVSYLDESSETNISDERSDAEAANGHSGEGAATWKIAVRCAFAVSCSRSKPLSRS